MPPLAAAMPICKLTFVEKIEKGVERYDCSLCVGFTTRNNASRERQDHADAHGAELEYEKRPTRVKLVGRASQEQPSPPTR